jgi:hypothetical protein
MVDVQQLRPEQRDRQPTLLCLRHVAGLIRAGLLATVVLLVVGPPAMLAADPAAGPGETARPPTCAERFPAEGPAGVDLRLGCIVSELIGLWRPDQDAPPPTLSAYAIAVGVLIAAIAGLGLVGARLVARGAGRRLAPTTPGAWWVCPTCRSINGIGITRCYNCAAARPAAGAAELMATGQDPATPQSFGRGKHD